MTAPSRSTPPWRGPSPVGLGIGAVLLWCALAEPSWADAVAGALVAGIAASGLGRLCPIPRAHYVPLSRLGAGVRRLPRWLWSTARDSLRLIRAAGSTGRVGRRRLDTDESLAPPAHLAAAVAGMTLSPTSIVLGLDPQRTGLRVHQLPAEERDD